MHNLKLIVCYDGTDFFGFQEALSGRTVVSVLREAFFQIFQMSLSIEGASRTDRGVHAKGQVVSVLVPRMVSDLQYHLNRLLPKDIVVLSCVEVELSFHPTLEAIGKEYHYNVSFAPFQNPFERFTHWHAPIRKIDLRGLEEAREFLLKTTDFSGFTPTKKREEYSHCRRTLCRLEILFKEDTFQIQIVGDAFLYRMARIISGTLVMAASSRLNDLEKKIEKGDRSLLGITAPPHGLTLFKVFYNN